MASTQDILNSLIAAFIPVVNKALPDYIKKEGLDPWDKVAEDSDTLGKINLGICKAKVKASYSIKDMKGLSSLVILSATLTDYDASDLSNVKGKLTLKAELTSSLTAKVSGSLKASCGGISEKVSISGKATAKGVEGKGDCTFTANLSSGACLNELKISTLKLDYDSLTVSIDNLGVFNDFLKELEEVVEVFFGDLIKGLIADTLKPILNDLIKDELPFCM